MLEVYEIKKERYFIESTSLMVYFLDLQSALTEMNNMNNTKQRLPKQQQINKTELNPLILNINFFV